MAELTALIRRAHAGDAVARNAVFNQLYGELQRLARARLARGGRNTLLETSALVNEAFIRLAQTSGIEAADRSHFLAYASQAMRSVIVDFVRARSAARRGGGAALITLNTSIAERTTSNQEEILSVHEALEELASVDPRVVSVVEMRYFAGLTEPEVAQALGLSERTVRRAWEKARLLLTAALARKQQP
jgi:RNA polymerase sigma factor (TIGR02999 family)